MGGDIKKALGEAFMVSADAISNYERIFTDTIKPRMELKYLSHLLTSIEDLINDKLKKDRIEQLRSQRGFSPEELFLMNSKNVRLFSIQLIPCKIPRLATVRYHKFGVLIFYSPEGDKKQVRILIAHELGHILNKRYLGIQDNENTANLFSFIAMRDKNQFYREKCREYVFPNDLVILHEIEHLCPLK